MFTETIKKVMRFPPLKRKSYLVQKTKKAQKSFPYILVAFNKFEGKITKDLLEKELAKYQYSFPDELIDFWLEYGGGELFQTQNILYPFSTQNEIIESMPEYNKRARNNAMNSRYIVFATDTVNVSVIDTKTNQVVLFDSITENASVLKRFANINQWFDYVWDSNM